MSNNQEIVFIIDDDQSVRQSLSLFLKANDIENESFSSAEGFLERTAHTGIGCLLLDVNMEGKTGFDLQEELTKMESHLPVIFITGRGSIHMSVHALKKGAVDYLEKPFSEDELLQSIKEAFSMSLKLKTENEEKHKAKKLLQTLTPRESEILRHVITGMPNKKIAFELQIAEQTVKLHRQKICEKLGVKSVPELIGIAEKACLP
jgi:FixJ family two-component response regulator